MSEFHSSYEYDFNPSNPNNTASSVYRMARAGGNRVLDLGSGPGIVSSRLQREDGRSVTCLDSDPERLAAARDRGVERTILADLNGDVWADELVGERFDVVILADVLEHLVAPGTVLDVVRERLLSDDGFLVASIPNASHEGIIGELISGRFTYREAGLLDSTHLRFFTLETFERLAEEHGFAVEKLERTLIPLEDTEMNTRAGDLPVSIRMEILRANPEARTYQFVVRLGPVSLDRPKRPTGGSRERTQLAEAGVVEALVEVAEGAKTALAIGSVAAEAAAHLVETGEIRVVYVAETSEAADSASVWGADRAFVATLDDERWTDHLAGESFDVIILGDVIERCVDPWAVLSAIRDGALIAPAGAIAAVIVNMSSHDALAGFFAEPPESSVYGLVGSDRLRFFTRRSLIELFEREGFVPRQLRQVSSRSSSGRALPPAVRRYLDQTPDASTSHFVIRAQPAGEADELARLVGRIEQLQAEHGRLLDEITAERKTFNRLRSADAETHRAMRTKIDALHARSEKYRIAAETQRDLARAHRRELSRIRRSGSWRIARRLAAIAHAIRDPSWAMRELRARSRSSGRPPPDAPTEDVSNGATSEASPEGSTSEAIPQDLSDPSTPPQTPARSDLQPEQGPAALPVVQTSDFQGPRVSIVIPVYNGRDVTRQCLESIFAAGIGVSFEVIVVDNASSDGISQWLAGQRERWPSMNLISNDTNRGFGPGVNQGADGARGDYMLICNSDVIIPAGAVERLVRTLDDHPDIGIVSPVTNYVGEGPQLDVECKDATPETVHEHAGLAAARNSTLSYVPDRLVFFCVLVRKSVFAFLGGLPEVYGIGNFEDDDFCVRSRMAGYRLAIDPNAFVFHHGSASWNENDVSHRDWMERNRPIYFERVASLSTSLIPKPRRVVVEPGATVVVRTVDRPELLRQALTSLANQTFDDFEVVVVNDGGPRIDDLLAEFDRHLTIRYVHHPQARGRSSALNDGIAATRGRWITYLDDDDIVYPTHLDVLVNAVRETGFQVAYADVNTALCFTGHQGSAVVKRKQFASFDFDPNRLLVSNRLPIQSVIHAAACVPSVGAFDESLDVLEDWDFMIRLSRRFPFYHVRRVTSEYRFRVSTDSESTTVSRRDEVLAAQLAIYERYEVSSDRLREARLHHIHELEAQIRGIEAIRASSLPISTQTLEIASLVLGFPPVSTDSNVVVASDSAEPLHESSDSSTESR